MAAAPAFPHNPAASVPDYFEVFGLPRRFAIDRAALERRFYELSRGAHPDRFATAGADALRASLERMSLLNEAYRVLKSPDELRAYFLRLHEHGSPASNGGAGAKPQIPAELAESWFELQDAIMEEPAAASDRVAAFEGELATLRTKENESLAGVERQIDAASDAASGASVAAELLERLEAGIRQLSYLASMERDVQRLKQRIA